MKKCVALAVAASTLVMIGCQTTQHATRWEYKVARIHLPRGQEPDANQLGSPEAVRGAQEALLNELGKEGWVLVSQTEGRIFYFKRSLR